MHFREGFWGSVTSQFTSQNSMPNPQLIEKMAGPTRLELATSCVTGRRSNRLNYGPAVEILDWWAVRDLNTRPSGCKPDALTAELTAPCV